MSSYEGKNTHTFLICHLGGSEFFQPKKHIYNYNEP